MLYELLDLPLECYMKLRVLYETSKPTPECNNLRRVRAYIYGALTGLYYGKVPGSQLAF